MWIGYSRYIPSKSRLVQIVVAKPACITGVQRIAEFTLAEVMLRDPRLTGFFAICQLADVRVRSAGVAAKVHPSSQVESFYFLAALIFAHRSRCAAATLFLPAADIFAVPIAPRLHYSNTQFR
jgi:hypothetical protein